MFFPKSRIVINKKIDRIIFLVIIVNVTLILENLQICILKFRNSQYFWYNPIHMMEKLKFVLFSIVTLTLVGIVGYWSVTTIQSGTEYVADKKIKQLEQENKDLKIEVKKFTDELVVLQSKLDKLTPSVIKEPEIISYKYQNLIDELQKLIDGNIVLKGKSRGVSVGTVQKFLNIYNNTSTKVDNDYGGGTVNRVKVFQKDLENSELNANGEAGKDTFNAMIDWLKKQS